MMRQREKQILSRLHKVGFLLYKKSKPKENTTMKNTKTTMIAVDHQVYRHEAGGKRPQQPYPSDESQGYAPCQSTPLGQLTV